VFVDADRARMAQVIGNLLQNAVKFTGLGGRTSVSVALEAGKGRAVIRVADTGVGIAPEMLNRLFEPFAQADTSLDRGKGGLGLGLALAKGLVDLHGGEMHAYSEGPGKGAEFTVSVPIAAPIAHGGVRGSGGAEEAPRRILIIEDNVDAADSLREVLQQEDQLVEVAYNGPAGIEKAHRFRPDVIVCDIGLPGMDGYEVARVVRADDSLKRIGLVALTGYALPEDIERARASGFDEHIAKPPSVENLQQVLRHLPEPTGESLSTRDQGA
jgi:two-component system CheB/CheR fusion protein